MLMAAEAVSVGWVPVVPPLWALEKSVEQAEDPEPAELIQEASMFASVLMVC
jgi:hypothetical protein